MATVSRRLSTDQRKYLLHMAEEFVLATHSRFPTPTPVPAPIAALRLFEDMCTDWVCDRCGHSCTVHSAEEEDAEWRDRRCRKCACAEFVEAEWAIEGE